MKFIERIILTVFSIIMLIISILSTLCLIGLVNVSTFEKIYTGIINNSLYSKILLGINIIIALLSLYGIFVDNNSKENKNKTNGILLENNNGKLLISKETLENLVNEVAQKFEGAKEVTSKVYFDKENNVIIDVNLYVFSNTIIKELSTNLQEKIKEKIKATADLDIKSINIKVKDIAINKQIEQDV